MGWSMVAHWFEGAPDVANKQKSNKLNMAKNFSNWMGIIGPIIPADLPFTGQHIDTAVGNENRLKNDKLNMA